MPRILCSFILLVSAAVSGFSLDANIGLALGQNVVRKTVLVNGGLLQYRVRAFELNSSARLSQDIGKYWSIGGNWNGLNQFVSSSTGTHPVPEQSAFGASVTFQPFDLIQFCLDYNFTASSVTLVEQDNLALNITMAENEPDLSVAFDFPIDSDWFALSASFTSGYYFSPYTRGAGFSINIMPEFLVTDWSLTFDLPVTANYSMAGYRGSSDTGFDSVTAGFTIAWSPGEIFTLTFSAVYDQSLSSDQVTRIESSGLNYQLSAGFLLTTDTNDTDADNVPASGER